MLFVQGRVVVGRWGVECCYCATLVSVMLLRRGCVHVTLCGPARARGAGVLEGTIRGDALCKGALGMG
jgi:hypothetical protein